jgi:hypothetical protein
MNNLNILNANSLGEGGSFKALPLMSRDILPQDRFLAALSDQYSVYLNQTARLTIAYTPYCEFLPPDSVYRGQPLMEKMHY